MSELTDLETRLSAAMDRLEAGVAGIETSGGKEAELAAELEAVQSVNVALEQSLAAQQEALGALDAELQRLRDVNMRLEDNNAALRAACQTGQVDAALINLAMVSELESLRAQRSAEKAEADAALASLDALVASVREDA